MKNRVSLSADYEPLNPNKRVNYAFGMVMGGDDYRQEQERFLWKYRIHNLLTHGYGTVCGLQVARRMLADGSDVEIVVSTGSAVGKKGDWICVKNDQCAQLNQWVQAHKGQQGPFTAPGHHDLYVKLGYRETQTDLGPIAARPCASEEETRAPLRILEAFRARFSWVKPDQLAEDRFRAFGELLARVDVISDASPPMPPDDGRRLLDMVRNLGAPLSPCLTSPPLEDQVQLDESSAREILRKALTLWITEVCPRLEAAGDDSILLACIHFEVGADGNVLFNSVEVDDCDRPILVLDRLKQ
jgi:hypothetical protein